VNKILSINEVTVSSEDIKQLDDYQAEKVAPYLYLITIKKNKE
jgi:hypothetical protein